MAGRFTVESIFKGIDKVTRPVSKMSKNVGKFTRKMSNQFRKLNARIKGLTSTAKSAGAGIAAGLAIGTAALIGVINVGADFQQSLVNAAAKMPEFQDGLKKTSEDFIKLKKIARDTGRETEFSARAAAEGLNFLAMAGFNVDQSVAALPGLVDLATASQLDLGIASNIATDTLGAFGLAAKDAEQRATNLKRVNDVLARSTTSANTNMEQLFEAVQKGGPAFTTAGQSMESFVALTSVMADAGIKGAEAGTVLRNMVINLANPTSQAADILDELGIEVGREGDEFRDIIDILGDYEKATKDMGTKQKLATTAILFGKRGVSGMSVQLKKGKSAISDFRDELLLAEGASGRMAKIMRDTTRGAINTMKSSFESLLISIFDTQEKGINSIIVSLTSWIRKAELFIETNDKLVEALGMDLFQTIVAGVKVFGLFVAGVVALNLILLAVNITIGLMSAAMLVLKLGMIALTVVVWLMKAAWFALSLIFSVSPFGAVMVGMFALVALVSFLINSWDKVVPFFTDLWGKITTIFKDNIGDITGLIETVTQPFKDLLGGVTGIKSKVSAFFGFADSIKSKVPAFLGFDSGIKSSDSDIKSKVFAPEERIAKSISEIRETSDAEITIRAEKGTKAEITKRFRNFNGLKLQQSGAFN